MEIIRRAYRSEVTDDEWSFCCHISCKCAKMQARATIRCASCLTPCDRSTNSFKTKRYAVLRRSGVYELEALPGGRNPRHRPAGGQVRPSQARIRAAASPLDRRAQPELEGPLQAFGPAAARAVGGYAGHALALGRALLPSPKPARRVRLLRPAPAGRGLV